MFLTRIAFKNQAALFYIVGILMLFGVFSYFTLPAREDPELLIREAVVTTVYPGLEAEQIEQLITKPLEEALITVPELEEIKSVSQDGVSIIKPIVYDRFTRLDQIWDQVEETVRNASGELPDGAMPSIVIDDFGDVAVITLALYGKDYDMGELFDYAQHVRDQLITVKGTKKVDILGAVEERIYIEFEDSVLAQAGLTPDLISAELSQQNIIRPGGEFDTGNGSFILQPTGDFQTTADIGNVLIKSPISGSLVRLGDVANVVEGFEDPVLQRAYYNGEEAVVLAVAMQNNESVITYSKRASAAIDEIGATLPVGLGFDIVTYESDKVEAAVYGVTLNMVQTLAIVLGIVILFLGLRTGLIVGAIIPTVILATIAIMGFFVMPLERMSLATIIIALGLLVDNGIVVAEDFKRRLEEHGDRDRALNETSSELAFPLLASSMVTIAVFLPLMIAQTESSEYTRSISLVILISLSISWVFAMTVTTALCHKFIKADAKPASEDTPTKARGLAAVFGTLEGIYIKILRFFLRLRIVYIALMAAIFAGGAMLMGTITQKFFPDSNTPQILVYMDLPAGVTSRTTDARIQELVEIVSDRERYPEFEDSIAYVGFGGPRFVLSLAPVDPAPNIGFMVINVTDIEAAKDAIPRLRNDFRSQVPDVDARVSRMFLGPADTNVIQVQVKGPDADYVYETSKEIEAMLAEVPGMIDIWGDWRNRVNRFEVVINQQLARDAGVTSADVSLALARFVSGQAVSEFRDGDEVIPITMRAVSNERTDFDRLETISVYPRTGGAPVPLAQVATIERKTGFAVIEREDLTRTLTVEARNLTMTPEDLVPQLRPKIQEMNARLAPGHSIEFDGILDDTVQTNAALAATLPAIIGLIVLLLILQFNGYRKPLVIMMTLPFIISGAAVGLVVMQAEFGFMVILGLYALAGIIINNSIVLMDRIEIEMRNLDQTPIEAVEAACRRRFRPILMTAITTIVGLLPLIIAQDVLFYGMSVAIAFGLGIGTFLITLGLVPILFCLLHGIRLQWKPNPKPTEAVAQLQGAQS